MAKSSEAKHALIVGIDFGTTFTGVSWAFSGQPEEINVITQWDSLHNFNSDLQKCPTRIEFSKTGKTLWGYGIPATSEPVKWFKLLLVDREDLSEEIRTSPQIAKAHSLVLGANETPVGVTGLYLRHLWIHTLTSIKRQLGEEMVAMCQFRVVITLPAIWPPYTQEKMTQAAKEAGILDRSPHEKVEATALSFVSEPEAAALATLKGMMGRPTIKMDDHFIVCDAGGGTVDLISYVIRSVDPFIVSESVKGSGGLCGAVFLDERFEDMLKEKVTLDSWSSVEPSAMRKVMNDDWEHGIKPQYDGQDRNWILHLPPMRKGVTDAGKKNLKRSRNLVLKSEDLNPVFNPIAANIVGLILAQANQIKIQYGTKPKYVILVGGFGRCKFLYGFVKSALDPGVELLQAPGDKPWTAICRGAVLSGLNAYNQSSEFSVNIGSRIARASYGTMFTTRWKENAGFREDDRQWDDVENCYKAANQLRWFLSQGDDVLDKQPVKHTFYHLFEVDQLPSNIRTTVFYSYKMPPPPHATPSVDRVCTIRWDPRLVTGRIKPIKMDLGGGSGRVSVYRIQFEVQMRCNGVSLEFSVLHDKQLVATENVQVDFGGEGSAANRTIGAGGVQDPYAAEEQDRDDQRKKAKMGAAGIQAKAEADDKEDILRSVEQDE